MIDNAPQKSSLLKKALMSNAVFSAVSGTAMALAAPWLSERMGIPETMILRVIGISLLGFAVALFLNAKRAETDRKQAWVAVGLDFAWVIGSVALVSLQILTVFGNWAVAAVADLVLLLALAQALGLHRTASRSVEVNNP